MIEPLTFTDSKGEWKLDSDWVVIAKINEIISVLNQEDKDQ